MIIQQPNLLCLLKEYVRYFNPIIRPDDLLVLFLVGESFLKNPVIELNKAVKYLYNVTEGSLLQADNHLSPKSDVWHIGLTVFEMMTLKTPHFCAVDLELQEIDEEDDDYSEIWDETFHQMIGRRPAVPHWIGNTIATNPEYQTIFDIFIACSGKVLTTAYVQLIY